MRPELDDVDGLLVDDATDAVQRANESREPVLLLNHLHIVLRGAATPQSGGNADCHLRRGSYGV